MNDELYYMKTATPRVEGGFGLAYLENNDTTTIPDFLDKLQQQSPAERVLVIKLLPTEPLVETRLLISRILQRSLSRGESDFKLAKIVKERCTYTLIIIDHAERLHEDALAWITSVMRTPVDTNLFMLVVRDRAGFDQNVDRLPSPDMFLGRAIYVDFDELRVC